MKAQSSDYIRLQNIYKARARQDQSEILHSVRAAEKRLARKTAIEEKEIEAFCKNAAFVKLVHGRRIQIADENLRWEGDNAKAMLRGLDDPDSLVPIAIAFLAYDRFYDEHGRAPRLDSSSSSSSSSPALSDHDAMTTYTHAILHSPQTTAQTSPIEDSSTPTRIPDPITKALHELLRAQGGELHNISALTGGMVAQEVIKVVTKQYVPVAGSCVFDGVGSRTWCF